PIRPQPTGSGRSRHTTRTPFPSVYLVYGRRRAGMTAGGLAFLHRKRFVLAGAGPLSGAQADDPFTGEHRQAGGRGQLRQPLLVIVIRRAEEPAPRREADAGEGAERLDAVSPGQLLALRAAAGVIVDRHFVDPVAEPQDAPGGL